MARALAALDLEPAEDSEARLLTEVRRLAASRSKPISPLHRWMMRVGWMPTEGEIALLLLQNWPALSPPAKKLIGRSMPQALVTASDLWVQSGRTDELDRVFDAIGHCPPPDSLRLVDRLLRHTSQDVHQRAAEVFATILSSCGSSDGFANDIVAGVLNDGPQLPDRRVLLATLPRLHRAGATIRTFLLDDGHPTHMLLRSVIRTHAQAIEPRTLIELLAVNSVSAAARDAIERRTDPDFVAAIADSSHLLLNPRRRRKLGGGSGMRKWIQAIASVQSGGAAQRHLPRLLCQCGSFDGEQTASNFTEHAISQERTARAGVVLHAAKHIRPDHRISDALRDLNFDSDPRIARRALFAIQESECSSLSTTVRRQRKSPHGACRAAAEQWLARHDVDRSLRRFDSSGGGVALRSAMHHRREETLNLLRDTMLSGETDAKISVILWARRLEIESECELELLAALAGTEPRVIAAATSALAGVGTNAASDALVACLNHADMRVRANAIEAIAWRGEVARLNPEIGSSPDPRVRANACRAFLRTKSEPGLQREGIRILNEMVQDIRPGHRRSAMWLTERLARTESAQAVATIASSDPELIVRRRARQAARRLLAEMRADITVRIAPLSRHRAAQSAGA